MKQKRDIGKALELQLTRLLFAAGLDVAFRSTARIADLATYKAWLFQNQEAGKLLDFRPIGFCAEILSPLAMSGNKSMGLQREREPPLRCRAPYEVRRQSPECPNELPQVSTRTSQLDAGQPSRRLPTPRQQCLRAPQSGTVLLSRAVSSAGCDTAARACSMA